MSYITMVLFVYPGRYNCYRQSSTYPPAYHLHHQYIKLQDLINRYSNVICCWCTRLTSLDQGITCMWTNLPFALVVAMTACQVAMAIGGSWHGKRDRLFMFEAAVNTQSDLLSSLSITSPSSIFLHINELPFDCVWYVKRIALGKSQEVFAPFLDMRMLQSSTLKSMWLWGKL